jgi:hypothetical protein
LNKFEKLHMQKGTIEAMKKNTNTPTGAKRRHGQKLDQNELFLDFIR